MGSVLFMLLLVPQSEPASVALEAGPGLPCAPAELVAAVELRLPLSADGRPVRVAVAGLDAVEIEGFEKRRLLPLYGARGPAAARKIALFITDLVRAELEVELPPIKVKNATVAATPPIARTSTPAPIVAPKPEASRWDISAYAGVGGGTNFDRPTLMVGAEGDYALVPRLSLIGGAAFAWMPPAAIAGLDVDYWAIAFRAGVGFDLGVAEARGQLFVEPHRVATSAGAASDVGVTAGLSLGAARRFQLDDVWSLLVLGGIDLALTRREFQVGGETALATERALLWLAVGVSFGGET